MWLHTEPQVKFRFWLTVCVPVCVLHWAMPGGTRWLGSSLAPHWLLTGASLASHNCRLTRPSANAANSHRDRTVWQKSDKFLRAERPSASRKCVCAMCHNLSHLHLLPHTSCSSEPVRVCDRVGSLRTLRERSALFPVESGWRVCTFH